MKTQCDQAAFKAAEAVLWEGFHNFREKIVKSEDAGDVSPKAGNYLSGETAMILNHICGNIFFYIHCTI